MKLGLILITIVLLILVSFAIYKNISSGKDSTVWAAYSSQNLGFSISFPENLVPREETTNLSLTNPRDPSKVFRPYLRIAKGSDLTKGSFEKFYTATAGAKIENFQSGDSTSNSLVKMENLQVDGQPAVKITEDSKMPGPFYAIRIYVSKGERTWIISYVAPTRDFVIKREILFNQIVSTIKLD